MDNLFVTILRVSENGIDEIANEKLDLNKHSYVYDGFEFKILYEHGEYIQLSVYAYNIFSTMLLGASVDNYGARYGVKYDTPILIETDGGFAGVLCSYILQISKKPIDKDCMYRETGINETQIINSEMYNRLQRSFHHTEKIIGFKEMLHYIDSCQAIHNATQKMVQSTVVYSEHFVSDRNPQNEGRVKFQENLTLTAAEAYTKDGKHVAVLNFANPMEPGGGVLRGANAQEENICRSSNLYLSLISEKAKSYYMTNRNLLKRNQANNIFLGTDMVLYSPDIMVLKDTVGYKPFFRNECKEMYKDVPFYLDVLTCAAPIFSDSRYILSNGDLAHLYRQRIRNIFEAAIENSVEVLILGAFGCGAFHNPPDVAAAAFRSVLLEERYKNAFDEVVFAVKRTNMICPNIEAFEREFSMFPDINNNGNEKQHRLSWKWVCSCGIENHWDNLFCKKCKKQRSNYKEVIIDHS